MGNQVKKFGTLIFTPSLGKIGDGAEKHKILFVCGMVKELRK